MKRIFVSYSKPLKTVFVARPDNFKIIKPINYTERKTFKKGVSVKVLQKEHLGFVEKLKELNINVVEAPLIKNCPQQTFVRDLGFVLDDTVYIGKSKIDMRKQEVLALIEMLKAMNHNKIYEFKNHLEGGDIIINKHTIFVGVSQRTTLSAVEELKSVVGNKYKVVPLELKTKTLHLDTVFNFVGDVLVVNKLGIKTRFNAYRYAKHVVNVAKSEQYLLPSNFLVLNNKTILTNSQCVKTNKRIKRMGINVIEQNYNEMLKLGGSFRCCSLEFLKE